MSKYFSPRKVLLGTTLTAAVFLSGCGNDLEDFVITNNNNNVIVTPVTPVAVNDAFNALGNATVNQAATGVLTNDTTNGGTISSFDAVGNQGGTIVLNADGSFAYTPVFGFVGQETFAYTLTNAAGDSTATVTMTSTGSGFFVDNTAAPGGNGSQASPFDTLAAAILVADSGDTIFVSRGDGTSGGLAGAILLPPGVDLIGEGSGLVLAQTVEPIGQPPLITGPITCGGINTISGFIIDGSGSEAIIIDGVGDVTVNNNTISDPDDEHILCTDVTGTITISNNTFSEPPDDGIDFITVENTNTNGNVSVTNNIFRNDAGDDVDGLFEIDANGTSVMALTFSGNDAIGQSADDFRHGFYLDCFDTSQVTVTVDNNDLTNFEDEPIGIHANDDDTRLGGSITNNRITNVSEDDGIDAFINDDTVTISGNVITDVDEDGIDLAVNEDGGTFFVLNNNIIDAGDEGVELNDGENGDVDIAVRGNTVTSSNNAFLFIWDGSGTVCIDFTGNTVDENVRFEEVAGTMLVEQLDDLDDTGLTGNVFQSPALVDNVGDEADSVADGFCQIP